MPIKSDDTIKNTQQNPSNNLANSAQDPNPEQNTTRAPEWQHMHNEEYGKSEVEPTPEEMMKRRRWSFIRWGMWVIGALIAIPLIIILGLCIYLTPERIAQIVSEEGSKTLQADVVVAKADFSLLKSFPNFTFTLDSLSIKSRAFNKLTAEQKQLLPPDASRLISAYKVEVRTDILTLLRRDLNFGSIVADSVDINLVKFNDSIANYYLPSLNIKEKEIPQFTLSKLVLNKPVHITLDDVPAGVYIDGQFSTTSIRKLAGGFNRYQLRTSGSFSAYNHGEKILFNFPLALFGNLDLNFHPLALSITDFQTNSGDMRGLLDLSIQIEPAPKVERCSFQFMNIRPRNFLKYVLTGPTVREHLSKIGIAMNLGIKFTDPWEITSGVWPNLRADLEIPYTDVYLPKELSDSRAKAYNLRGIFIIDGGRLENSYLDIPKFYIIGDRITFSADAHLTDLTGTPRLNFRVDAVSNLDSLSGAIPALSQLHTKGLIKGEISADLLLSKKQGLISTHPIPLKFDVSNLSFTTPDSLAVRMKQANLSGTLSLKDFKELKGITKTQLIRKINPSGSLNIPSATILSRRFASNIKISNLSTQFGNGIINLKNLSLRSGDTSLRLRAVVRGLIDCLAGSKSKLGVDINVDADTLQINHLARAYALGSNGHGNSNLQDINNYSGGTIATDTLPFILPRNLSVSLSARAKLIRYMNLRLRNLNTQAQINGPKISIDTLRLNSDFGDIGARVMFDGSDPTNFMTGATLSLRDFNITRFFDNFQGILAMMPQAGNLSGTINADLQARAMIFPDMYVNFPSLWSNIRLNADSMQLTQSPLIHKIADMILIHTHAPLQIADISLEAKVMDNLIELYPFLFSCNRYRLQLGGINAFNGNLYYHIGVDRSPIPFRFGINITGDWEHPHLDFGTASFSERRSEIISSDIGSNLSLNLRRQLRVLMNESLKNASRANADTISL